MDLHNTVVIDYPSSHHVAQHHLERFESLQPHTEWSSRPGSEPPSVEADVYIWHYALLVVHAGKEEEDPQSHKNAQITKWRVQHLEVDQKKSGQRLWKKLSNLTTKRGWYGPE